MADNPGGAAPGAGSATGSAPGGVAPGGAPGGAAPPAGSGPGAGSGAGAGGGAGAGAGFTWSGALGEQAGELEPFVSAKGWKSAADAVRSYQNLETLFGADKAGRTVMLPGKDATPEEVAAFHGKLGRPDKADGYQLQAPKDAPEGLYSQEFAGKFREAAFAAGVSQNQAAALHDWWVGQVVAQVRADAEASARNEQQLQVTLDKEWGAEKPQKIELAKRAAKALFGDDSGSMTKIEQALGTPSFVKRMAEIGAKLGDDQLGPAGRSNMGMTPERAKQTIAAKQQDPAFQKALHERTNPGHRDAVAEWDRLHEAAYGGGAVTA